MKRLYEVKRGELRVARNLARDYNVYLDSTDYGPDELNKFHANAEHGDYFKLSFDHYLLVLDVPSGYNLKGRAGNIGVK